MSTTDRPAVKINEYHLPHGEYGRAWAITGLIMFLSTRGELLQPGSMFHDKLLSGRPTATKYARWTQAGIFYFLFGAHSIELVLFAWTRLRKHGVGFFGATWWKWMVTAFVGGKFTIEYFDKLVAEKAARQM